MLGVVVVVLPGLFVVGLVGVVLPLAGVVPEGVVVVVVPDPLVLPPTEDGLGEIVLGEPVTVDGVVVPEVLVPVLGTQLELEVVLPTAPVEDDVPLEAVVLGDAVVPLVPEVLLELGVHGWLVDVVPIVPPVVVLGDVVLIVEFCPELIPLPLVLVFPMVLVVPTVLFDPAAVVPSATPPGVCTGAAVAPVAPAGVAVVCVEDGIPTVEVPAVLFGVVPAVPAPVVPGVPGVAVPAVCATAHVAVRINPNVSPRIFCIVSPSLPLRLAFRLIYVRWGCARVGWPIRSAYRELHTLSGLMVTITSGDEG